MVESSSDKNTFQCTGIIDTHSGLGLHRDPSSLWFDEDGTIHLEPCSVNTDSTVEDFDFVLPMLNQSESQNRFVVGVRYNKFPEKSMHLNGGSTVEEIQEDSAGTYAPFDIENESPVHRRSSNVCADGASDTGTPRSLPLNFNSLVSAVDVLKTLFFILVWYTFSTFLSLYNKTLLGDDLGKFPAPLLMNTVHFTMQAVLSKLITWYWSHRFLHTDPMTWRDYFYKDGLCLSQLYLPLFQQHWTLT